MSVFDGTVSPTILGNGRIVIGAHSHINGADAEPSGVIATKHELEQLARYWYRESLDNDFICYFLETSGSYEWRLSRYCEDRLDIIEQVLGQDRMNKMGEDVVAEYRTAMKLSDEAWRIFAHGTPEERRNWLAVHGAQAQAAASQDEERR